MQLSSLFPIAQELTIKDGLGEPTEIRLQVVGMESTPVRQAAKRVHKAGLGKEPDIDMLEKSNAEVVASCIVGWSGIDNADGPVPYSHAKALEYMLMPELTFMRDQVESYVSQRANFFRASGDAA